MTAGRYPVTTIRLAVLVVLTASACQTGPGAWCRDGYCGVGYECMAVGGVWQCIAAGCGNGVREDDEICDDGNQVSGDGCRADCRSSEICGDGIVDEADGEICDDGNSVSDDGCSADCTSDETCGNDIVDRASGEICDDGNTISGDGCRADCRSDETCGNDLTDMGEACDDGNEISGDGCSAGCTSNETCGNRIVDEALGEICDDGNHDNRDGCPALCKHDCNTHEEQGYRVCHEKLSWMEARDACQLYRNYLVIINDTNENTIVSGLLEGRFWIGLSDREEESDWRWLDGARVLFSSWYVGEPNNEGGNQDCGQANFGSPGLWDDVECDILLPFICEISAGEPECGNGRVEPGEACDDGNEVPGDGCDDACRVGAVVETEPNEDGSPEIGGPPEGNDFTTINASSSHEADTIISATLAPAGDEDVFAVGNRGPDMIRVRFDTYAAASGLGVPCPLEVDTVLLVRDIQGNILAGNDDRGPSDLCSTVEHVIEPGETVYAHVLAYGDSSEIPEPGYWLTVDFP